MKPDYLQQILEEFRKAHEAVEIISKEFYRELESFRSQEAEKGECEHSWVNVSDSCLFVEGPHQHCHRCGKARKSPLEGLKEVEPIQFSKDVRIVPGEILKINALIENQNKIVSILKQRE